MEINERYAHITCVCGEKFQAIMEVGNDEKGDPVFDTDHDKLSHISKEHWKQERNVEKGNCLAQVEREVK